MTGSSTTLARHALEGRDSPTTHRNIMTAYYLYLALGENQPYIGFTHDPCLDSTLLGGMGCTRLFAASQPLPIDLAAVAAWHLWEKTGAYHPAASSSRLIGNPPTASRSRHSPPRLELPRLTFPANPRSLVEFLASSWTPRGERALRRPRGHRDQVQGARSWLRHIRRHFRRRGLGNWREIDFEEITIESRLAADIPSELLEEVGRLIEGRVLSYDEVRSLLEQRHVISPYPLRDLLQACALAGKLEIWPGVISPLEGYHICCRCGERQQLETIDCPLCGRSGCVICLACRSLGEIRSCRELYYGSLQENSNSRRVFPGLTPQLEFRLTRAQAEAAAEFKGYVATWLNDYLPKDPRQTTGTQQSGLTLPHLFRKMSHDATSCLIWAVCGAGKTEIAFEGLALAIAAGLKAVFAVPRRDVVLEVAKRAQAAFPELSVTALYGGAKHEPVGPLVVATTHQLIRFHSCFDLAILDEADAFPYAGSAMLHRALQRAVKPGGLQVFMTATPHPALLQAARGGKAHMITVPVRHHGHPVPVPQVILCRHHLVPELRDSHTGSHTNRHSSRIKTPAVHLPEEFWLKLKESLAAGKRVFVFVPRIWLVEAVAGEIAACSELSPIPVFATHSRDPRRDEQRELFVKTAPSVMVTTSVLERGITVPKADVIVLYAHDDLYDARTLIQMAGRSGRSASHPIGSVYFLAAANTKSIQWAVASLKEINAVARARGLLVGEESPRLPNIEESDRLECNLISNNGQF